MEYSDIASRDDLALFLGVQRRHLTYVLYSKRVENCYRSFDIPKKNGEKRTINAPDKSLKPIQEKLACALWCHLVAVRKKRSVRPNISHAFEKRKSIITNAKVHRGKRFVFNVDLKDFFNCFNFGRVQGFFEKNEDFHLPKEVATVIAQLTCYQGHLPQGAPSSPIITNLICQILDFRLLRVAKKYKLDYTRYADDLTFSTNNCTFLNREKDFQKELREIIERAGFSINEKKTRLQIKDSRQVVTGLTVNKKLNVPREYRKNTRAMAHSLYTQEEFTVDGNAGTVDQLEGRFAYINQLDRHNNILAWKIESAAKISKSRKHKKRNYRDQAFNSREMEYRKFLFYKYFYNNEKPLIITEGKTDVVYLRAALKNLYLDYPNLITKKQDGSFEYEVSFLKKTDRLKYFLGLDFGADAMRNFYSHFTVEDRFIPNYLDYFKKVCPHSPNNPVMLFFDNEQETKRPLHEFISSVNLSEEKRGELKKDLQCKLIDNGNLFLVTHQLIKNKTECEIEDLFKASVLNVRIEGKSFSRDANADPEKNYGKTVFATYVANNYESISFDYFKPALNAIDKIVSTYQA